MISRDGPAKQGKAGNGEGFDWLAEKGRGKKIWEDISKKWRMKRENEKNDKMTKIQSGWRA